MLSVKALKERAGQLLDRVQAISKVAEDEKRDLTAEERTEVDRIMGKGKPGEAGHVAGDLAAVEADLDRAERIEVKAAELAKSRVNAGVSPQAGEPKTEVDRSEDPRYTIPIEARYRHGSLKAFKGQRADERAYASGQFLLATFGSPTAKKWCHEHGLGIKAALSTTSGESGGVLVPEVLESTIVNLREQYGIARSVCQVYPMSSDTLDVPRRTAGVSASFTPGENGTFTQSQLTLDAFRLVAKRLYSFSAYSNEIADDAVISVADLIADEMSYAFAVKEDQSLFIGDGTSTYGGIVGINNALTSASISVSATGHTGFATLTLSDFEAAISLLPIFPGIQPRWYISQIGYWNSMAHLMDAAGGNRVSDIASEKRELMFLGVPVTITQALNTTLGADVSQIKCLYGDLKMGVAFGSRKGIEVMSSPHFLFNQNQIAIRGIERFDISVHEKANANTKSGASSIVALKTASS